MFFHMVYKSGPIFLRFCHNSCVWRTDERTEFSSLDRVCIACSAVKMKEGIITHSKILSWTNRNCILPQKENS